MDIMRYHPEDESKPYKIIYLEDPFGNLFELYYILLNMNKTNQ